MGNNEATALRRETVLMLEEMGIPVEYSQHEDAPSQHEIDLRYTDAMTMADTVMLVRVVVKEMATRKGILATFMPKPLGGVQGSGMHTHVSLFDGDTNAFYDDSDEYHLSTVARQFMAGVLHHASEITAITNQWVNSYKRLIVSQEDQPLIEAPVYISWAQNNRSALVRVPPTKKGKRDSTRVEYRSPDPGANPYLAWAVILAAGLAGIRGHYELPTEASANIYKMSAQERIAEGIKPLPASLNDALDAMETSELVAETLGEHVFEWFLRNKRAEWAAYKAEVTPFELRRYLTAL
jgi:glutamine synthetase